MCGCTVWEESYTHHESWIDDMVQNVSFIYVSYFESVPVGIEDIQRHFNVLLNALATPLKLSPLQGQIQVIASVT